MQSTDETHSKLNAFASKIVEYRYECKQKT